MTTIEKLQVIFNENKDKRICVVGTTCIGKSTMLKSLPQCLDMDKVLFPLLTQEEKKFVCQDPWTGEIGEYMDNLAKSKIKIESGKPVFGTVVFDCDLLVHLDIEESVLKQRVVKRGADFQNVTNMSNSIKEAVNSSNVENIKLMITNQDNILQKEE